MSSGEKKVFDVLVEAFPDDLSKADIAERAGFSPTSGGYGQLLARLNNINAIEYPRQGYARLSKYASLEEAR